MYSWQHQLAQLAASWQRRTFLGLPNMDGALVVSRCQPPCCSEGPVQGVPLVFVDMAL